MNDGTGKTSRPLVDVVPEQLSFKLVPNTQPGCPVAIRNSSAVIIAFKVKTTEPRRYLVRPNQGLVRAGAMETVNVYLIEKECNELLQNLPPEGKPGDKFLVQTTAVGDAYYAQHGTLNPSQKAEQLTNMWSQVEKSAVRNKKLSVRLVLPNAPHEGTAPSTPLPSKHALYASPSPTPSAPPSVGAYMGGDGGRSDPGRTGVPQPGGLLSSVLVEDQRELVTKYDDLVNYTANLTEERDELRQALEGARKELQNEMAARMMLENKDAQPQTRKQQGFGSSRTATALRPQYNAQQRGGGFGWFTLTLVAVVFFFLGQWLDVASAKRVDKSTAPSDVREVPTLSVTHGGIEGQECSGDMCLGGAASPRS